MSSSARPPLWLAPVACLLLGCNSESGLDAWEVRLDPYGVAPLSAVVELRGIDPALVEKVRVVLSGLDGEDLVQDLAPADRAFETNFGDPEWDEELIHVPVLGLYPGHRNRVRVEVTTRDGDHDRDLEIETRPLDASFPTIRIVKKNPALMEPGWNLAGFSHASGQFLARPFIYDHFGKIRWVLRLDQAISPGFITPIQRLANGNLCCGCGGYIYEYNMLGREVNRWILPTGYTQHHDVFEMPGGNLLVASCRKGMTIVNGSGQTKKGCIDHVLELDRQTGAVVNIWDLRQYLDVDRYAVADTSNTTDFFHLNAVLYSEADDSIIVSGKHQGLLKITRGGEAGATPNKNKQLRWILAPHRSWGQAGADGSGIVLWPFLLKAIDQNGTAFGSAIQDGIESNDEFGWVYTQHAPLLLDDATLFIFDNGGERDLGRYAGEPFSRGVEFRVVEDASGKGGTISQVWQYGKEREGELHDPVISDVDVGPTTGNRFIMPGSYTIGADGTPGGAARMVEVTYPEKTVVFEAQIHLHGKDAWGDDICYRQERMSLFP
jgi:arylsulfate sulfotransferase